MTDSFYGENRAAWRVAVQRCLGIGADPFAAHTWTQPRDIAAVLALLCDRNLSYACAPGGGGYEFLRFLDVDETTGVIRLLSGGDRRQALSVARLDYLPHPIDPADSVFRVEISPAPALQEYGAIRGEGFRQLRENDDGSADQRWLKGVFVFTAKKGVFNAVDPDHAAWDNSDPRGLQRALASMVDPRASAHEQSSPHHSGNQGALQSLVASPLTANLHPSWIASWLSWLPASIPYTAVEAAARFVAAHRAYMPSFPEFRDLCERARDGLGLDAPYITRVEENAMLLLRDIDARYREQVADADLADALLVAAAVVYLRDAQSAGIPAELNVSEFATRAKMFGQAGCEWAQEAQAGKGVWEPFFNHRKP